MALQPFSILKELIKRDGDCWTKSGSDKTMGMVLN